ncbi:hypothetical protein Barb4_03338 [Bacteroidales bacterium Barb4]|nr:hypothetical protein Barb4_03338 [Bacteroidales bacterium Barb4]
MWGWAILRSTASRPRFPAAKVSASILPHRLGAVWSVRFTYWTSRASGYIRGIRSCSLRCCDSCRSWGIRSLWWNMTRKSYGLPTT